MTAIGSTFNAAQTAALRSIFSAAGRTGDQPISKSEADQLRKHLPAATPLSGSSLAKAFALLDSNNDKRVSSSELAALVGEPNVPSTLAPTLESDPSASVPPSTVSSAELNGRLQLFSAVVAGAHDKNNDGAMSKDDLEEGRKALPKGLSLSGSELARVFAAADADRDKTLTMSEIAVFLASEPQLPKATLTNGAGGAATSSPEVEANDNSVIDTPEVNLGAEAVDIPDPFPVTGPYKTDKIGAINVFGMAGEPQSAEKSYSLNYDNGILRVEAQQGDRRQKSSEIGRAIERSEVSFQANPFEFGQDYHISFDMMFQGGEKSGADNDKFFQIHNVNDPGDASLGPIFAMQLEGDRMRIVTRSDSDAATTKRVKDNWIFEDTKDIDRDHWYSFDIALRVDPFGNGQVSVRRDGVEIASYEGAIGYNDAKPPYAKVGVYRDTTEQTQVRFYKDLKFERVSN